MKLLFICSRNRIRSLTAERLFDGVNGHQARSAGTEVSARIRVTSGHLGWAEIIFVMEKRHLDRLRSKFRNELIGKRVVCLHIPDVYTYMDEALIERLTTVTTYLSDREEG
ncbi:MAG: protein tyrosine phosphatase [Chloroflexi bacterium]|nr:protein tyrosine phosphatase [Chloroflexota bacterium]